MSRKETRAFSMSEKIATLIPCRICGQLSDEERAIGKRPLTPYPDTEDGHSYYGACSCGVCGPHAENREEAIEKWNEMMEKIAS